MDTTPFDASKYLDTDEDREDLLAEAFRDGSPEFIDAAIEVVDRSLDRKGGK